MGALSLTSARGSQTMNEHPSTCNPMTDTDSKFLRRLGVYGYDTVEPIILAALVSGDPLLLVGRHGTGKTFLLNSLSEALGLEHRHYNASLVSFDDLVGFPFPEKDGSGIRFIETPATVWQAQSVLVDELNRCKPEHQNRFFSLVHERRIQGVKLERLRYRWAAMNPAGDDNGYIGTEPLDPALADRFAFVVPVVDWEDLSPAEQLAVADPRGDGAISRDEGRLAALLSRCIPRFEALLKDLPAHVPAYAAAVVSAFGQAGLRLSPRRTRQLARNLLAASVVSALPRERLFRLVLRMSIPQLATGESVPRETVEAAHRIAWDSVALEGSERWLHEFTLEKSLAAKARKLLAECPDPDTGSVAIAQLIAVESSHRAKAFALAVAPLLLELGGGPVGAEGLSDLTGLLQGTIHLARKIEWRDNSRNPHRNPQEEFYLKEVPGYAEAIAELGTLETKAGLRCRQLLDVLVAVVERVPEDWPQLQAEFQACVNTVIRMRGKVRRNHGQAAA
jgi:MoxR-like ATPase